MLATTLAAVLAVAGPNPSTLLGGQETPYQQAGSPAGGYQARVLNDTDLALFRQGLAAARARDLGGARSIILQIGDPTARRLVEWALLDTSAGQMSFDELAETRIRFEAWPRTDARLQATEKALSLAYAAPNDVLPLFHNREPLTAEGMVALADALDRVGRQQQAQSLVRTWWRTRSFDAESQARVLNRWGGWLNQDDHDARLNMLLLGPHGPATRAMVGLASPERQTVASAVMALRGAYSPESIVAGLSPAQALDPAVVLERVRILRAAKRQAEAFPLLSSLPAAPSHTEGQNTLWSERRNYFLDALAAGNGQAAYDAMAGHGFPAGERKVDAEFFAGWAALTKLRDPQRAMRHFEALQGMSTTPITQGRARYWLGRAAEAMGDRAGAQAQYADGARHIQTFYGQLAAEKAGYSTLTLPGEPQITEGDVRRFEANELVKAARILGEAGEPSLLRVFAYHLDDTLPAAQDLALLMDLARGYGEGFTAMMVGRAASQRGFLLPERQYPIRIPPQVPGAAPLEFTLAITRQESSFDPRARSHADARGMMQFLPTTASGVARRLGMPYSAERLWDADYNMSLGSYHLAELTRQFGGSPLLTTIGYNAGPARAPQWVARCGDPRQAQVDPVDFIECAPFTETRNYMMRVMENLQVYRARLNGGSATLNLSQILSAGAPQGPQPYADSGADSAAPYQAGDPGAQ